MSQYGNEDYEVAKDHEYWNTTSIELDKRVNKIASTEECQILGIEPSEICDLLLSGEKLEYSFAEEMCDVYDGHRDFYDDYCEYIDRFNEMLKEE